MRLRLVPLWKDIGEVLDLIYKCGLYGDTETPDWNNPLQTDWKNPKPHIAMSRLQAAESRAQHLEEYPPILLKMNKWIEIKERQIEAAGSRGVVIGKYQWVLDKCQK